jgi:chromosome partitioning protein
MPTALEQIENLQARAVKVSKAMKKASFSPDEVKTVNRTFGITEAAAMVGRTRQTIDLAIKEGHIKDVPQKNDAGRRMGFILGQINKMRDYFGTRPRRQPDEDPVILSFQSFKGGVAKTTTACHFAEYLAMQGYKVLLVDCDSQASATHTFGYFPDLDLTGEDTLLPYFRGEAKDLGYAVRPTYWDGLDLIPSNLSLYNAEYELAHEAGPDILTRLRDGIQTVEDLYDVIILDPPPALGMISLNVMYAINALVIPMPPSQYDFASTVSFLTMLSETMETIKKHIGDVQYNFVRILNTRYDDNKSAQASLADLISDVFGQYVTKSRMKESAEIQNAGNMQRTVYELERPATSAKTHKRCVSSMDAVFKEIETEIRKCWRSHHADLRDEGLM